MKLSKLKLFYTTLAVAIALDEYVLVFLIIRHVTYGFFDGIPVPLGVTSIIATDIIIFGPLLPAAIVLSRRQGVYKRLKLQSRVFLQVFPSIAASSESMAEALEAAASLSERPLRDYISAFSALYRATGDAEGSFRKVFSKVPREVRLLLSSIVVAERSGGRARDVLEVVSKYAAELDRMEFSLFNRLRSYSMIVYMGVAVYGAASGIGVSIARSLSQAPVALGASQLSATTLVAIEGFLYYALIVLSLASAYVMAKAIDDYPPKAVGNFMQLLAIGSATLAATLVAMHGPGATTLIALL
ncbi:type II secretion system F family protein [Acidilobus sp.]|uniref:type II secretion system F family protein n=1 Tax=Acidilobus sp. TaxID=1872109 RepID=UPI003D08B525